MAKESISTDLETFYWGKVIVSSALIEISTLLHAGRTEDAIRLVDAEISGDPDAMIDARLKGKTLTPRQRQIYEHIIRYRSRTRFSPTYAEIGDAFDISVVTVLEHVRALAGRGVITFVPNLARSIRIT